MKNIKTYEEYKIGVTFEDYLYKNYINKDLSEISRLYCMENGLIDLIGFEKFTNCLELNCSHNEITSLKGIGKSTRLGYLSCVFNKITSLNGIENLINLKTLWLDINKLTSLKGIEKLTKLINFGCSDNPNLSWVDYIDKNGNEWYIRLPKSIERLDISINDKFNTIEEYWKWFEKNQPAEISKKFNF